jgi:hypothetical protein
MDAVGAIAAPVMPWTSRSREAFVFLTQGDCTTIGKIGQSRARRISAMHRLIIRQVNLSFTEALKPIKEKTI